jgi:hypothetical protein
MLNVRDGIENGIRAEACLCDETRVAEEWVLQSLLRANAINGGAPILIRKRTTAVDRVTQCAFERDINL